MYKAIFTSSLKDKTKKRLRENRSRRPKRCALTGIIDENSEHGEIAVVFYIDNLNILDCGRLPIPLGVHGKLVSEPGEPGERNKPLYSTLDNTGLRYQPSSKYIQNRVLSKNGVYFDVSDHHHDLIFDLEY